MSEDKEIELRKETHNFKQFYKYILAAAEQIIRASDQLPP